MFRILLRSVAGIGAAAFLLGAATPGMAQGSAASPQERVQLATKALQGWYDEQTGLYKTTGWWNSANAITTLTDEAKIEHSHAFDPVFANTFQMGPKKYAAFINDYYDDEGWWALAWIGAYDVTHRPEYLAMAESIFKDMSGGWSDTCGGGIWWSKERKYKNAIANELYLSVAAHLATRAKSRADRKEYLETAEREWKWFAGSGMINSEGLVNDGLNAKCENNHETTWSYNQGVVLGGLTELSRKHHDAELLFEAKKIVAATMASPVLVKEGVLHDPCEPKCGGDGSQFKGIFVRNLRELNGRAKVPGYGEFVQRNADSIWADAKAPEYHLGVVWATPYGDADASSQSSALDALVAAEALQ
ncbi:glycoside hydrolase family 76 protein [Silvibacterium sp.]|uniref:glycoside hydrolase family 76 protein n=1 Tax=Silvibacterium sp. TaxID=1964179 RepID=UPI0039E5E5B2